MKHALIGLLIALPVWASAYPCPSRLQEFEDAQTLHAWLSRFSGPQELTGCMLEITACDPNQSGGDALIGEIYIVDEKGREAYLPLIYVPPGTPKIRSEVKASKRRLHYLKVDTFYEDEFGRTEAYRMEMRLDPTLQLLRKLDLGTYSTKKKLHQPNGNESRWYSCGG